MLRSSGDSDHRGAGEPAVVDGARIWAALIASDRAPRSVSRQWVPSGRRHIRRRTRGSGLRGGGALGSDRRAGHRLVVDRPCAHAPGWRWRPCGVRRPHSGALARVAGQVGINPETLRDRVARPRSTVGPAGRPAAVEVAAHPPGAGRAEDRHLEPPARRRRRDRLGPPLGQGRPVRRRVRPTPRRGRRRRLDRRLPCQRSGRGMQLAVQG